MLILLPEQERWEAVTVATTIYVICTSLFVHQHSIQVPKPRKTDEMPTKPFVVMMERVKPNLITLGNSLGEDNYL